MNATADPTPQADDAAVMAQLARAMALVAAERIGPGRQIAMVDQHTSFLQAARPEAGPLQATARATGGGRAICFCEAELADASGTVLARAMASFRSHVIASTETPCT